MGTPVDPIDNSGPLLEACTGAGATLVAIVGGLLVTRYITLESELQATRDRLARAETKLSEAEQDLQEATQQLDLYRIDNEVDNGAVIDDFLKAALEGRTVGLEHLRRVANLEPYTDDQVIPVLRTWNAEATKVIDAIDLWNKVPEVQKHQQESWREFKRGRQLPVVIDPIWSRMYDKRCAAQNEAAIAKLPPGIPNSSIDIGSPRSTDTRDEEERLVRLLDDARSACDRLRIEVAAARQAKAAISRPPGLVLGLVVLALLTLSTVVMPVIYLTPTPATLTYRQAVLVVAVFFSGIVLLFGYMVWHVYRLRKLSDPQTPTARAAQR